MTPITIIRYMGREISVKRDDLFPVAGGGNKGRKLKRIFSDDMSNDCSAIITNGGTQSNHARVCAVLAAEQGLEAHLVLHGLPEEKDNPCGNMLISMLAGANIYIVSSCVISEKIEEIKEKLREEGKAYHVIPGGAHCLSGGLSYVDSIGEIDGFPDVLVLPTGTGATQAGIMAGLDRVGAETRVVGISVARLNPRGKDIVFDSYKEIRKHLRFDSLPEREVIFDDRWVCGGYGRFGSEILEVILKVGKASGLVLDPIYTGKAFWGMSQLMKEGLIGAEEKVMFWNTGGLINSIVSDQVKDKLKNEYFI